MQHYAHIHDIIHNNVEYIQYITMKPHQQLGLYIVNGIFQQEESPLVTMVTLTHHLSLVSSRSDMTYTF